jgi:hypothetical protein
MLGLAVALMGAGAGASSVSDRHVSQIVTNGQMSLRLTSTTPGVTFDGRTLICPPMLITTSSGTNRAACRFTIESIGSITPATVSIDMSVTGISAAQVSGHKFAVDPNPGPLVYLRKTPQTLYTLAGGQLPVTVDPAVAWGASAGSALDNSDLGATIVIAYNVVAEALGGETASPVASGSEIVEGETATPGRTATPPPTSSRRDGWGGNDPTPWLVLLICLMCGTLGLAATRIRRRSIPR